MKQIDFTKYSAEELKRLILDIENHLYEMNDGYVYICIFRQYGRVWEHTYSNLHIPEKYAEEFNGDNGIMDIYTTNPNLEELPFYNYGDTFYVESIDAYIQWRDAMKIQRLMEDAQEDHHIYDEWVSEKGDALRDIWTGAHRPREPYYTLEQIDEMQKNLDSIDYVEPVLLNSGTSWAGEPTHSEEGDI